MKAYIAAASALLLLPAHGWTCTQDLDCGSSGRCVKSAGAIYGACVRDVLPSNPDKASEPFAGVVPLDKEHCAFDADCGAGRACMKASATAPGVCVKQR